MRAQGSVKSQRCSMVGRALPGDQGFVGGVLDAMLDQHFVYHRDEDGVVGAELIHECAEGFLEGANKYQKSGSHRLRSLVFRPTNRPFEENQRKVPWPRS